MNEKVKIKSENMTRLSQYREQLLKNPRLTYLFIEMTNSCNLNCLHCGSGCGQKNYEYIETDILLKTLKQLAGDYNPQAIMICLTGGEPLLHPDFFKIVEEIVNLGFPWGITTNGTLIDIKKAKKLKDLKLESVSISLDGLKENHEWLRNVKGCFDKTIDAVKYLNSVNIPVQITTVIHKKNFHELEEMLEFIKTLNIASWRIVNVEPIGRALKYNDILLSYEEMVNLIDFIREKRYSKEIDFDVCFGCSHYLSFEYEHEVRDNYFICGAGIYVGSILCNGDIYSCLDIERRKELVQGNIRVDRFSEVWENKFKEFRENRVNKSSKCIDCIEREFCNADSMHTWDFEADEPMFCILRKVGIYEI
ncbi:MAG: radical SAM protein [Lachnospiraceae bacterium]|nr:radical SAM protein [Lachnospiraceae bacterium]